MINSETQSLRKNLIVALLIKKFSSYCRAQLSIMFLNTQNSTSLPSFSCSPSPYLGPYFECLMPELLTHKYVDSPRS
jgi:hypothetical protein